MQTLRCRCDGGCVTPKIYGVKRSSVVSFVSIAKHGNQNFANFSTNLLATCETVVQSPERFAQTGTGWVLRELGVAEQEAVINFNIPTSRSFPVRVYATLLRSSHQISEPASNFFASSSSRLCKSNSIKETNLFCGGQ